MIERHFSFQVSPALNFVLTYLGKMARSSLNNYFEGMAWDHRTARTVSEKEKKLSKIYHTLDSIQNFFRLTCSTIILQYMYILVAHVRGPKLSLCTRDLIAISNLT